jgi:hypothetical protein
MTTLHDSISIKCPDYANPKDKEQNSKDWLRLGGVKMWMIAEE